MGCTWKTHDQDQGTTLAQAQAAVAALIVKGQEGPPGHGMGPLRGPA